jgi:hypothetical protein
LPLSAQAPEDGMNLRIVKYGYGMDLFIVEINRDQLAQLEKSCSFLGLFYWKRSLQNMWYLNEKKMSQIFGVGSFRQMKSGNHRYLGPVLQKKSDLDPFLEGIEIFEDDQPVKIDSAKISTSFKQPPPFPSLTDKNVLVCHGEYYQGTTCFETQISDAFCLKHLRLHFTDCGGNGHILQKVAYKGHKIRGIEEADRRGFLKPQFIVK